MDKYESIKLNKEFRYLYARAQSYVTPHIVVYIKKNRHHRQRLGITSAKKIGKAVQRNRARRIIRVAYRQCLSDLNDDYDMIIVARTRCVHSDSNQIAKDLYDCLKKAGVLNHENNH